MKNDKWIHESMGKIWCEYICCGHATICFPAESYTYIYSILDTNKFDRVTGMLPKALDTDYAALWDARMLLGIPEVCTSSPKVNHSATNE